VAGVNWDATAHLCSELGFAIKGRPVQIALPYVYRHKPLFCKPLLYEIGQLADSAYEIVVT
jgi:hypothetical protein